MRAHAYIHMITVKKINTLPKIVWYILHYEFYMLCIKSLSCIGGQFLSCILPPGQSTSHSVPQLWHGC